MQVENTPQNITKAGSRAAKAAQALAEPQFDMEAEATPAAEVKATKTRKNFFFVFVRFKDGTGTMSHGLRGAGEINAWLATIGTAEVQETTVLFGHERKAKRQTRLVFA